MPTEVTKNVHAIAKNYPDGITFTNSSNTTYAKANDDNKPPFPE